MDAIVILLAFALSLLYIAFYKKDSTLIFLSGLLLLFAGLEILIHGFLGMEPYYGIAVVTIFIGVYLMIRTGVEMIADKKEK